MALSRGLPATFGCGRCNEVYLSFIHRAEPEPHTTRRTHVSLRHMRRLASRVLPCRAALSASAVPSDSRRQLARTSEQPSQRLRTNRSPRLSLSLSPARQERPSVAAKRLTDDPLCRDALIALNRATPPDLTSPPLPPSPLARLCTPSACTTTSAAAASRLLPSRLPDFSVDGLHTVDEVFHH